ncbi:dynein axonemal assembly factor 1 homolog [Anopheles bellator]|uniref:dynein axonemal assembly factor 1 homolog n=1 Tax=Anopheles bellator TaxID=139047 RepID=UPI002648118A|nr:dynein axonemal assembly factor 1 homolog [Anopheles bellator]
MVREQLENDFGPKKMTKKSIQASCRKNKLYLTPHLNDVLYLHYSGYNAIECLDEYVGLKCLWLECNAISSISGLKHQAQLRCLYLHNNLIKRIENLEHCKQLDTLNLSHNHITKVENCGVDILPVLNTLNLSHNYLKALDSVEELRKCDFVSVLDISHNRIEDIAVVKILGDMKGLRVLTLTGNPVVNEIPSYRKTLILECKSLTYLDSRPVFEKDRACAEAWKRGGYEEERREHLRWKRDEQRKMRRNINATLRLRHRGDGEPELLKTSSDEGSEGEPSAKHIDRADGFKEEEYTSNEAAWKEMEQLFGQHPEGTQESTQRDSGERPFAAQPDVNIVGDSKPTKLVEEITPEEYTNLTTKNVPVEIEALAENELHTTKDTAEGSPATECCDATNGYSDGNKVVPIDVESRPSPETEPTQPIADNADSPNDGMTETVADLEQPKKNPASHETDEPQGLDRPAPVSSGIAKAEKIASAEMDDTLNVTIQSKQFSITMQPAGVEAKRLSDASLSCSEQSALRKDSVTSTDNVTGSDSNSDPTLVTDYDRSVRNSSLTYTSGSDTSDSEDMFDKIVPKKHRKLATTMRTEPLPTSSSSSSSSINGDDGNVGVQCKETGKADTVTELIDEYKRFFHSVDVRDPKCIVKNRHKLTRPQTAKSQRTEPIVYDGVLSSMELESNASKIEQARQEHAERSMAKEAVFERLLKGHSSTDRDIEEGTISIGGKEHNFREYRLEEFRKDQEKLQTLIERVTAQKEKYNAHIDSIHDQLANIMEDYGQISAKLKRVDDMIQTIGDEVNSEEKPTAVELAEGSPEGDEPEMSIVEQIVERMTKEPSLQESRHDSESMQQTLSDTSTVSSSGQDTGLNEFEREPNIPSTSAHRKSLPVEFNRDPVYRKFIDIQYEIDKLTEDEIFCALEEAARELQDEQDHQDRVLHDEVDEYWSRYEDIETFRRSLNLNAHPIIQRFKHFIECQCETDTDTEQEHQHVRKLEQAYQKYERRLSNHLFDEYLIMSRKVSIATTTGGESSATDLELIEIDPGSGMSGILAGGKRATAWDLKEPSADEQSNASETENYPDTNPEAQEELEDEESKPEEKSDTQPEADCGTGFEEQ